MAVQDGAFLQVTSQFSFPNSSVIQNVWHFIVEATLPASEALVEIAAELFLTNVWDNLEAVVSSEVTEMSFAVDEVQWNAGTGRWEVYRRIAEDLVTGFVPASVAELLPPGVSANIEFLPVYRRNRGYKYLGGLTEWSNEADGTPSAALLASLINVASDAMMDYDIETGVSSMYYVILNRTYGVANKPTAAIVRNQWSYQRRRKFGKGL